MTFEVKLPDRISVWCLRAAGIDVDPYLELDNKLLLEKARLPASVSCNYFLADKPSKIQLTLLSERPAVHLRLHVANAAHGRKIRAVLNHYSADNNGTAVSDREDRELDRRIAKILRADDTTPDDVQDGNRIEDQCQQQERGTPPALINSAPRGQD